MIKQYYTIASYAEDTLAFLLEDKVKNNIVISQCLRTTDRDKILEDVLMLNVFAGDKIVITAFRNLKKMLIIGKQYQTSHLNELVNYLREKEIWIEGVVGECNLTKDFSDLYVGKYRIHTHLVAHELIELNEVNLSEGRFEPAKMDELDTLADWFLAFQDECDLDYKINLEKAKEMLTQYINLDRVYKWVVESEMVSICAENARTDYFSKISLVYTPPKFRKKNYARSCVYSLSKKLLDEEHKTICLFTDKSNATSNKIYYEIGFRPINEDYSIEFIN